MPCNQNQVIDHCTDPSTLDCTVADRHIITLYVSSTTEHSQYDMDDEKPYVHNTLCVGSWHNMMDTPRSISHYLYPTLSAFFQFSYTGFRCWIFISIGEKRLTPVVTIFFQLFFLFCDSLSLRRLNRYIFLSYLLHQRSPRYPDYRLQVFYDVSRLHYQLSVLNYQGCFRFFANMNRYCL